MDAPSLEKFQAALGLHFLVRRLTQVPLQREIYNLFSE